MSFLIFIAILVALVWVHELGHFSVAKLFGIRVSEFAIGFPPRLVSVQWGETRYSFNLLLVGGYVNIQGESGEEGNDPRSMANKPRPMQAAVLVAGIAFNLLFAWGLLAAGYMAGLPSAAEHDGYGTVKDAQVTIVGVLPGSPADTVGVEGGDKVRTVYIATEALAQGASASQVHDFLAAHQNDSVVLVLERQGQEKDFVVKAAEGIIEGRKALGIELDDVGVLQLPVHEAFAQAGLVSWRLLATEAQGLGNFVVQAISGVANLGAVSGPIGIVSIGGQAVDAGFGSIIFITTLISINLALINIIPIPGLDGGRLLFIAVEGILRRPISPRLATGLTLAGFAFLIGLMILVSVQDIAKLVG